jgi:hypothetical protein
MKIAEVTTLKPLTPDQARVRALKDAAKRASDAVKREQERQKLQKAQQNLQRLQRTEPV